MQGYEKLTNNEILSLSETARNVFHLLQNFYKNENIKKFVNVQLLEDPTQKIESSTSGPFQFYFYENLFFPDENSNLHSYKKLTNLEIETPLNKLSRQTKTKTKNKKGIHKRKTNKNDVTCIDCPMPITSLTLSKIGDFGRVQPL